jgi:hypothetical protein
VPGTSTAFCQAPFTQSRARSRPANYPGAPSQSPDHSQRPAPADDGPSRQPAPEGTRRSCARLDGTVRLQRHNVPGPLDCTLTGIYGIGPVIAATVIGDAGDITRFATRDAFALRRHGADRGVLRQPGGAPAVPARQPPPEPRDPHGRGHPDPPPGNRRPPLLRQEDQRGARQPSAPSNGGSATPSTPPCSATPARPPPQRPRLAAPPPRVREGNRGTTLHPARPAHTPNASSSDQPLPNPAPSLRPPNQPRPRQQATIIPRRPGPRRNDTDANPEPAPACGENET